jgi:hypothetical protein
MHQRRAGLERFVFIEYRGQFFVFEANERQRVFGDILIHCCHRRYRIADKAHLIERHHRLIAKDSPVFAAITRLRAEIAAR